MHNQGLKDWRSVLTSNLSPEVAGAFLVGTLVGLAVWDTSNNEYYIPSDDLSAIVRDKDVREAGIKLLINQSFAKMTWRGLVLGTGGFRNVDYLMLKKAPEKGPVPAGRTQPPPQPTTVVVAPTKPETKPARADVVDVSKVKAYLTEQFSPYEEAMVSLRKHETSAEVALMIKESVVAAAAGNVWNGVRLLQYLSALTAVKHQLEVVSTRYTAKDQKMAADLVSDLGTEVLVELVPYFVFTYCEPGDEWKTPTVQTLLRRKTELLTTYKKPVKHAAATGKFK